MGEATGAIALGELVRDAERRAERDRYVTAVYRSGTVLALGGILYGGCWLYSALSSAVQELGEMVEGVTVGAEFAPEVFSDEGFEALDAYYAGRGWLARGRFRADYRRARQQYEATGRVRALPWALDKIDKWESILVGEGVVAEKVSQVHPVDKATGIILNNKWYWGVVLALAALPAVPIVKDVLKDVEV